MTVKTIHVEGYPGESSVLATDCEVTVDKIGVHCVDRLTFDETVYLFDKDPLSVLLFMVLEGSV